MTLAKGKWEDFHCVVRAWRLAGWAAHAWGNLGFQQLEEVWNLAPSLPGFCAFVPGYAVARGWIVEGPVGYGVLGPEYEHPDTLIVDIGGSLQVRAWIKPGETTIEYSHDYSCERRFARATVADGVVVGAEGYRAEPRDWARIARLLLMAEEPTDLEAEGIREALRNMVGEEQGAQQEFDKYFALTGPEILAGPEVIGGAKCE